MGTHEALVGFRPLPMQGCVLRQKEHAARGIPDAIAIWIPFVRTESVEGLLEMRHHLLHAGACHEAGQPQQLLQQVPRRLVT